MRLVVPAILTRLVAPSLAGVVVAVVPPTATEAASAAGATVVVVSTVAQALIVE